ncbi:MAG TPA: TIGR01212 family radical SAM protein [Candidatus Limnocylindrales bacterium]|nr:TIGR01212 family radical SAM protein [Candidatus Limnocylindrales bacterium]
MLDLCSPTKLPGWYYRLSSFFKECFGEPVSKIPLHAGFSCPNRDGTISRTGCSYCFNPSFAPFSDMQGLVTLAEQLRKGKKKSGPAKYLAYFQSYTNTYAPVKQLKAIYDQALADPEVIGLSIATRPDCISEEVLDLLEGYARHCHLWIEYGLQSAHDQTLKLINRGHTVARFTETVKITRNRGIYICAHIILGLPGETTEMMLATIEFLNSCGLDGVKFHHLQIIENTQLAQHYAQGQVSVFPNADNYVPLLCDCLERLSPAIVVHRLASQATKAELLIAPHWKESGGQIAAAVEKELKKRGTHQGCRYPKH